MKWGGVSRREGEMAAGQDKVLTRLTVGNVSQLQPAQSAGCRVGVGVGQWQREEHSGDLTAKSENASAESERAKTPRILLRRPLAPHCSHILQRIGTA